MGSSTFLVLKAPLLTLTNDLFGSVPLAGFDLMGGARFDLQNDFSEGIIQGTLLPVRPPKA
jgi:hypothetical protein